MFLQAFQDEAIQGVGVKKRLDQEGICNRLAIQQCEDQAIFHAREVYEFIIVDEKGSELVIALENGTANRAAGSEACHSDTFLKLV